MFCKLFMSGLCVAAAVMYFDWTGPFHWWVGLFVLGAVTLVSVLLHKRLQADDDELDEAMPDEEDEAASVGQSLVMGLVRGVVTVGVLALAFVGLSSTPLRAWIEGPDCRAMLAEIDILTTGQAHGRIVQVVDLADERSLGPTCRQDLRTPQSAGAAGSGGAYAEPTSGVAATGAGGGGGGCRSPASRGQSF